jgi:RNA polymerase sigma-70 factor, ECF subfamily
MAVLARAQNDTVTGEFETHRAHLEAVAYRMLGGVAEAEDAVQEAWLRWRRADRTGVEDPRAWLTTVTGRICLDQLRSARVRREAYVGTWLPEPVVSRLADPAAMDPGELAARTDEVSVALLTLLERLSPEQRVAFVLHDVFDVPFTDIATVLGGTVHAARQLASRARRAVREGAPRHTADLAEQRAVLSAFLRACEHGDLAGLLAVLAPDTVVFGDGGGVAPAGRRPIVGPLRIARFLLQLGVQFERRGDIVLEPVLVNGDLGLMAHQDNSIGGRDLTAVMAFSYADGRITAVHNQLNPAKLTRLPPIDPARSLWPLRDG